MEHDEVLGLGGGFEADHGALHALVGGEAEDWVSRVTWSASARRAGASTSAGSKVSASRARRRLALMAKLAARASAGGAAHAGFGEEAEQRGVVFVDRAQGVFHLGEGAGRGWCCRMRCCSSAKSEVSE